MSLIARVIVAGLLALWTGTASSAEPLTIRVGWVVAGSDSPFLLYGKAGFPTHEGMSYTLGAIHFAGTPLMITALASSQVDLAPLAYSSFALAIENAHMSDLRIIADVKQDGVPGYDSSDYMVRNDSPIRTVEDLKGKIVTTNVVGSSVDIALRAMLYKHHMRVNKDCTLIEVSFPNMKAFLKEKKADLIIAVPPFSYDPGLQAAARTLFTQKEAVGGPSQTLVLTARKSFLEQHRAAVIDYLEDSLRALRWYTNPANHKAAVQRVATFTKEPADRFSSWIFTNKDDYRDPEGIPNLKALQTNIDTQKTVGFLKTDLDANKYVDLSLVKEADKRIK